MKQKLRDVCTFYSGNVFPTKYQGNNSGDYAFYKVSDIAKNVESGRIFLTECNNYVDKNVISEINGSIVPKNTIVFAKIGEALKLNRRAITLSDCLIDNNVMGIKPQEKFLLLDYFYFFMRHLKIERLAESTTVPAIKKTIIENLEIFVPPKETQKYISAELKNNQNIINLRKNQLCQLDLLIKSRFVEMFGDVSNEISEGIPMTKLCSVIDGDRGKNYPRQDEFFDNEYCLFLNAKNVTPNGFDFSKCQFITKEKDSCLRKGKLSCGDVVLTTRGTIGNMAYYTEQIPFPNVRINSGMVILRMNKEVVNPVFFIEQFKLKLNEIKKKVASGTAQPQLPISTMSEIKLILPNIKLQNEFAQFVEQVEETKTQVQKSLDEAQLLFNSLMQEYFG